jgi:hypothetical protein
VEVAHSADFDGPRTVPTASFVGIFLIPLRGSGSLASTTYLRYGNHWLGNRMSKRRRAVGHTADGRHRYARTPSRSLTAVAIGGAGLVLAVPVAVETRRPLRRNDFRGVRVAACR